jgi:AcrR family transcriptional regulator
MVVGVSPPASASASAARPPRRDAVRNRGLLIAAATDAFRRDGLECGVDGIARSAGVGVATLYRHFPTKAELVLAVMASFVDELGAEADAAVAVQRPLAAFMSAALALQQENRGLLDGIAQQPGLQPNVRAMLAKRVVALLEPVAVAGHRSGELRPELDAGDLLATLRMLGAAATAADDAHPIERYLALLLRGLA